MTKTMYTEKQWRTRWRRWLGAKTRESEYEWTNLLKNNFINWAYQVSGEKHLPLLVMDRTLVKELFSKAIDRATIEDCKKLDSIFCEDQFNRKHKL